MSLYVPTIICSCKHGHEWIMAMAWWSFDPRAIRCKECGCVCRSMKWNGMQPVEGVKEQNT